VTAESYASRASNVNLWRMIHPSSRTQRITDKLRAPKAVIGFIGLLGVAIFMALSVILTLAVKQLESRLASWHPETAKTF